MAVAVSVSVCVYLSVYVYLYLNPYLSVCLYLNPYLSVSANMHRESESEGVCSVRRLFGHVRDLQATTIISTLDFDCLV